MIIDFQTNPDHARQFTVLDRKTGVPLNGLRIWYADDDKGFYRAYTVDEKGLFILAPGGTEIAWEEFAADIEIRPRSHRKDEDSS